mgnify:CR=1 FL=1
MMYTVKLINGNSHRDMFYCDTVEEANICAQFYMRHRTETTSLVYIVPCFDNEGYDDNVASECVKKCRLDEEDSKWIYSDNSTYLLRQEVRKALNILTNAIDG